MGPQPSTSPQKACRCWGWNTASGLEDNGDDPGTEFPRIAWELPSSIFRKRTSPDPKSVVLLLFTAKKEQEEMNLKSRGGKGRKPQAVTKKRAESKPGVKIAVAPIC